MTEQLTEARLRTLAGLPEKVQMLERYRVYVTNAEDGPKRMKGKDWDGKDLHGKIDEKGLPQVKNFPDLQSLHLIKLDIENLDNDGDTREAHDDETEDMDDGVYGRGDGRNWGAQDIFLTFVAVMKPGKKMTASLADKIGDEFGYNNYMDDNDMGGTEVTTDFEKINPVKE